MHDDGNIYASACSFSAGKGDSVMLLVVVPNLGISVPLYDLASLILCFHTAREQSGGLDYLATK